MDKLISDRAAVEISCKVKDILRMYHIDDWQSEPDHQQQNFSEIRYATIKRYVNVILDRTGAPANLWFLCLKYVCYLLNRLSTATLLTTKHLNMLPLVQFLMSVPSCTIISTNLFTSEPLIPISPLKAGNV